MDEFGAFSAGPSGPSGLQWIQVYDIDSNPVYVLAYPGYTVSG
jgi:hypothetical protein